MSDTLEFNQSLDGGTFEEAKPQVLSYSCLVKMAKRCLAKEREFLDKDLPNEATRYARIWGRIHQAMCNPIIFKTR